MLAAALPANARGSSSAPSARITPIAPAALALLTVAAEPHTPENVISAILPATSLVIGWHASLAGAVASLASATVPVRLNVCGAALNPSACGGGPAGGGSATTVGGGDRKNRWRGDRPS